MISIIVPTFNDSQYLLKCLESCLAQDVDKEIILIDDASTKPFPEEVNACIAKNNIRLIRHEKNQGLSASRNTGIAASKYDLFIPLDADDFFRPQVLPKMLEAMNDCDIVHGNAFDTGGGGYVYYPVVTNITQQDILRRNPICCSSLFRKAVWEAEPPTYPMSGKYRVLPHQHYEDYRFAATAFRNGFRYKYIDLIVYTKLNRPDSMLYQLHGQTDHFHKLALEGIF